MLNEILQAGGTLILKSSVQEIIKKYTPNIADFIGLKLFDDSSKKISEYIISQAKRHYQIKTLYTNGNLQPFMDIYYPLSISREVNYQEKEVIHNCSINNVFNSCNFISIIGNAGSGKSSLIKYLFLNCIDDKKYIPVLVELRLIESSKLSIKDYVYQKILNFENKQVKLLELLRKGGFVFFFDGYDELNSGNIDSISYELNQFIEEFNKNNFIITSRPGANVEYLQQFQTYQIMSLELKEVYDFTYKQSVNTDGEDVAKDFALAVSDSVYNIEKLSVIREFLTNPLLLTLYIFSFQRDASIPPKKSTFYSRVIDILLTEHDSRSKFNYQREVRSKLDREQFIKILSRFSFYEQIKEKYIWNRDEISQLIEKYRANLKFEFKIKDFIQDMKVGTSLWLEESNQIRFSHRSLQEYFAAISIKNSKKSNEIYKLLIEKIARKEIRDYQNLLSLCEEVDELMFLKFFKYPLLSAVCKEINNKKGKELVETYINLFHSFFYYDENGKLQFDNNEPNMFNALKYFSRKSYGFMPVYEFIAGYRSRPISRKLKNKVFLQNNQLTDEFWRDHGLLCVEKFTELQKYFQDELQKTIDVIHHEEKLDDELLEI